jgi:hypothetical protein
MYRLGLGSWTRSCVDHRYHRMARGRGECDISFVGFLGTGRWSVENQTTQTHSLILCRCLSLLVRGARSCSNSSTCNELPPPALSCLLNNNNNNSSSSFHHHQFFLWSHWISPQSTAMYKKTVNSWRYRWDVIVQLGKCTHAQCFGHRDKYAHTSPLHFHLFHSQILSNSSPTASHNQHTTLTLTLRYQHHHHYWYLTTNIPVHTTSITTKTTNKYQESTNNTK